MNKKNSGFSLVELIVVIAIMAILVGVLAPAYLKYVEKSRKSSDLDTLDNLVKTAETICSDTDYEDLVDAGAHFTINNAAQTLTYTYSTTEATTAQQAWEEVANVKQNVKLKSKAAKGGTDTIYGTLQPSGAIKWEITSETGVLSSKEAKSFKNKLGKS
jgi:prepilin-type N-terminal cleavage/methylation domain-containing protein